MMLAGPIMLCSAGMLVEGQGDANGQLPWTSGSMWPRAVSF